MSANGQGGELVLSHFRLSEPPFSPQPDPEYLYWSDAHRQAYTMLDYGLMSGSPITVITGEIGSGKTSLLRHLLRNIGPDISAGLVSTAGGGRAELLHWVLLALGQESDPDLGYVRLYAQFQAYLISEFEAGRKTLLIFDEAQSLSAETLEELRLFTNINADRDALIQLVLFGQPGLRETLSKPEMLPFAQRVAADYHIPALPQDEVETFIQHRLEAAGGTGDIFTSEACAAIHDATGGLPRRINQICDYSMVYAYGAGSVDVSAEIVAQVVRDRMAQGSFLSGAPKTTKRKKVTAPELGGVPKLAPNFAVSGAARTAERDIPDAPTTITLGPAPEPTFMDPPKRGGRSRS